MLRSISSLLRTVQAVMPFAELWLSFDENALISSLREIQAPVLLLWGEDDKWHPAGEVDEYRSSLRSCSCTVIRNAGHLVHEEKPDRIAELVRGFIPAGYDN